MTTPVISAPPPDRVRRPGAAAARLHPIRRLLPARSVLGFVALLALLFALSYAVGGAVGPVAPGLHPADRPRGGTPDAPGGGSGGMPGMAGMSAQGAPRAVPATAVTSAAAGPETVAATREARR
ncbi:hypothetical protein SAZ_07870 [Streptomyces noursei ZPM]|uniref:Uncharacterized protein n=1 Tax=Streptomyces noursei TaxID=1971 RepID=A0A059VX47_STRNR|nr:hypothetical protein [Streptomyces noursei]AKA02342.1 hypothetical protein SAZ_07870 [Streptomyces noursei ZPM]AIA01985.1 hypothetical protein DC74_1469 [Streptomyces noursei]EPY92648.1 hypothetical protein K530_52115 [Streptomyces noursei CCRC 11814]EXU87661.1 hypothetical protein P354_34085 [Streptomyces noursei PD-1]UWS70841.1 hypothetical protein N1H47_06095 [Streptomyces noursei]